MNMLLLIVLCLESLCLYFLCRYGYMAYRLYKSGKTRVQGAFKDSIYYCFITLISMLLLISIYGYAYSNGNQYEYWFACLGILSIVLCATFLLRWIYLTVRTTIVIIAKRHGISRFKFIIEMLVSAITILLIFVWAKYILFV